MSDYDRFGNARYGADVARSRAAAIDQGLRAYMIGVYNYMTLGLGVTGVVAYVAFMLADLKVVGGHLAPGTAFGQAIYGSPLFLVVLFAPLALVFAMGRSAMSVSATRTMFLVFAALMGLSLSTVFAYFTQVSIARVFFETAAAFGALSLYGYTTRRSLSAIGSFMIMGLFGLIIASVVNLFLQSTGLQWALSIVGIGVFAGLTAWDTQAIKESYFASDGYEVAEKKSIYGALRLYLDFINLFQYLLFLLGDRRS